MENTLALKFVSNDTRTAREEIDETILNAQVNEGRTLITDGNRVDRRKWGDHLEYLIAMTKDGKKALIGRINNFNDIKKNPDAQPNLDRYPQVPPHAPDDKRVWFELMDVREIDSRELNGIKNDEGRTIFDLLGKRASAAYVNYSEQ